MKTLRKLLCLILALTMILSCFILPLNAAEDPDEEDSGLVEDPEGGGEGSEDTEAEEKESEEIAVQAGDTITVGALSSSSNWFIKPYTKDEAGEEIYGEQVNASSPYVTSEKILDSVRIYTYTVPEGVAYVRIVYREFVDGCVQIKKNDVFTKEEYLAAMKEAGLNLDYLNYRDTEGELTNLFPYDDSLILRGKVNKGVFEENLYSKSRKLEVGEGKDVKAGDVLYFGAAYQKRGLLLSVVYNDGSAVDIAPSNIVMYEDIGREYGIYVYPVPENATEVYVVLAVGDYDRGITLLTKNQPFTGEHYRELFDIDLDEDILDENSPLYGLKGLFIGDSISRGAHDYISYLDHTRTDSQRIAWAGGIAARTGLISTNKSVSGARVSYHSTSTAGHCVFDQMSPYFATGSEFDVVVMHGGVNDCPSGRHAVGTPLPLTATEAELEAAYTTKITDNTNNNTGKELYSYAAGLQWIIYNAKKNFTNAEFFFVANFQILSSVRNEPLKAYLDVAREICEMYGVHYIDLYNNEEVTQKMETTTLKNMDDALHPNGPGYDVITPYIQREIEAVMCGDEYHQFTAVGKDDTHHYTACKYCGLAKEGTTKVAHTFDTSKITETHHWTECECGAVSGKAAHDYSIPKSNGDRQWNECSCGLEEPTVSVWDGKIAIGFSKGDGTEGSPYQIWTAGELAYLAKAYQTKGNATNGHPQWGKYYRLMVDIDLAKISWSPIGPSGSANNYQYFKGVFDGNGHTVYNVVNAEDGNFGGLFGVAGGEIKNLTVAGESILRGNVVVGGIVGGTNSSASSASEPLKITNCQTGEDVEVFFNGYYNTYNPPRVGGICGNAAADGARIEIRNCVNRAYVHMNTNQASSVKLSLVGAGGIVGAMRGGLIKNCVNYGKVELESVYTSNVAGAGGILGIVSVVNAGEVCEIENVINFGEKVSGLNQGASIGVGGVLGVANANKNTETCDILLTNAYSLATTVTSKAKTQANAGLILGRTLNGITITNAAALTIEGIELIGCIDEGAIEKTEQTNVQSFGNGTDFNEIEGYNAIRCSLGLKEHTFDNVCDTECNECGATRTAPHDYTVIVKDDPTHHWTKCSVCGDEKEGSKEEHNYADDTDTTCDCGYERTIAEPEPQAPHAEAIKDGSNLKVEIVESNKVTLKAEGELKWEQNTAGKWSYWLHFQVVVPEGVDPANVTVTYPDGSKKLLSAIMDETVSLFALAANGETVVDIYWGVEETSTTPATFGVDWNSDGTQELSVALDTSNATLAPKGLRDEGKDVTAEYAEPTVGGATVYSIDIVWGSLKFTYTAASEGTWDPEKQEYVDATEGGWSCDEEGGNAITVTNRSNAGVKVTIENTDVLTGLTLAWSKETFILATADNGEGENGAGKATSETVTLTIEKGTITESGKIGTVTVTITDASASEN